MVLVIHLSEVNNTPCSKSDTTIRFVLGFLAYLALGKTHEECIQAGTYCAFECIQQSGCTFPEKPVFDPTTFVV